MIVRLGVMMMSGCLASASVASAQSVLPAKLLTAEAANAMVKIGNDVLGGVGVGGAPRGDKDEACATAGLAKVADQLK